MRQVKHAINDMQILASRYFGERDDRPVMLDEKLKSELASSNSSGRQYRASTALSSFMRPQCRKVDVSHSHSFCAGTNFQQSHIGHSLGNDRAGQLILFVNGIHHHLLIVVLSVLRFHSYILGHIEATRGWSSFGEGRKSGHEDGDLLVIGTKALAPKRNQM